MSEFEEKVIKLLETINGKLDKLLGSPTSTPAKAPEIPVAPSAASEAKSDASDPSGLKPSELIEKQKEEDRTKVAPPIEGRRVCPECGGTDFAEREDRSQPPIHQMGGIKIYKKKITCKKCSYEFPV